MYRVGLGCDQHRYTAGEGIVLGGVKIPSEYAVIAHSDGDTLLHALTDALLGAVAFGDIGELFPDTSQVNKGRDSSDFLRKASDIISEEGYEIVNIDATIQVEKPKLSEYKREISCKIASIVGIASSFVSIKAKTAEGMDAIGMCEGIRADVVVLLRRVNYGE